MDGCHDTFIHWFLFKEEPNYTIDFGPKNGCDVMLNQTLTQLKPQARYHGNFSFSSDISINWNDDGIVGEISKLIAQNHPVYRRWDIDYEHTSFTLNMFSADFQYGDFYFYFDSLRLRSHENENNKNVVECISELIRYAQNMKHWLVIVRKTYYFDG